MSIRPTFYGIEIGKTGIVVSQLGLDVTGHNIANVDTPGYTRQRLVQSSYAPYGAITRLRPVDMAKVGGGTYVKILDQVRSKFLDDRFREENTLLGNWQTRTEGLSYIEALFETNDQSGVNKLITDLFESFNIENAEANDREQREIIKQSAISLTTGFNQLYNQLIDQQKDQDESVKALATEINTILDNIAMLNKSIFSYELLGDNPANDLRDRRNLLLDELSYYVDIEYKNEQFSTDRTNPRDEFELYINGILVVEHNQVLATLDTSTTVTDSVTGQDVAVLKWVDSSGTDIKNAVAAELGGELGAHLDLRDNAGPDKMGVPYFVDKLNTMARALVQIINDQHSQGWTHSNGTGGSQTGIDFFDNTDWYDSGGTFDINLVTAGNLSLNSFIQDSYDGCYNIAVSSVQVTNPPGTPPTNGLQNGNQENMRLIYELFGKTDLELTGVTGGPIGIGSFSGFMSSLTLDIALERKHSTTNAENQSTQVNSVDYFRTSISGVSLDEEMTNMLKYQHAYNGSARVITAMDEAIDVIVNKMGLVGR